MLTVAFTTSSSVGISHVIHISFQILNAGGLFPYQCDHPASESGLAWGWSSILCFLQPGQENGESLSSAGGLRCSKLNQKLSNHLLVVVGCSQGRVPPHFRASDEKTLIWYSSWVDKEEHFGVPTDGLNVWKWVTWREIQTRVGTPSYSDQIMKLVEGEIPRRWGVPARTLKLKSMNARGNESRWRMYLDSMIGHLFI